MTPEDRKTAFLAELRNQGRSSPGGIHWDRLCKLLRNSTKAQATKKLPAPLILAASIASHADKYRRLNEHLDWAIEYGCLDDAIEYLENLPPDAWNVARDDADWDAVHPWAKGDW